MFDYFYKTHEGEIAVMFYKFCAGSLHFIAAPATHFGSTVLAVQLFDQIAAMQISTGFPCYDVVAHRMNQQRSKIFGVNIANTQSWQRSFFEGRKHLIWISRA